MFEPLYVAATGMNVFEDEMVDITNNLANARTVGFKKGRTEKESLFTIERTFQKELRDRMYKEGVVPPFGPSNYGTGVRVVATSKDFSQGTVEVTNNPLDLSIHGDGFFKFAMPDGSTAYGRAGNLHIDNAGNIVDPNGYKVQPSITVPEGATNLVIRSDGTVLCSVNNGVEQEEIGQLTIVRFANANGLENLGQNLYRATDSSGDAIEGIANSEGYGSINQYSLELSNVDVISEMMRMVMIQRVFDTVSKAVQSYDAMLTALERVKQ